MAEKNLYVDLDLNEQSLLNAKVQPVATDPASPAAGRVWHNNVNGRLAWSDGTNIRYAAHLDDLEQLSAYVGAHDASGGIPSAGSGEAGAIRAGDRWYASVAGTIVGVIGSDVIEVGDMIVATVDGAAAAADFLVIQTNIDVSALPSTEVLTLASLPANTATAIGTGFTTLHSVQVWDSANEDITSGVVVDRAARDLESNVALTGLTVTTVGTV